MTLTEKNNPYEAVREPVLSPVDRVSELLFGLFMALTFVGTGLVVAINALGG